MDDCICLPFLCFTGEDLYHMLLGYINYCCWPNSGKCTSTLHPHSITSRLSSSPTYQVSYIPLPAVLLLHFSVTIYRFHWIVHLIKPNMIVQCVSLVLWMICFILLHSCSVMYITGMAFTHHVNYFISFNILIMSTWFWGLIGPHQWSMGRYVPSVHHWMVFAL